MRVPGGWPRTLAPLVLLARLPRARPCEELGNCSACVDHTKLGTHNCYWCEIDERCHGVGSSTPCSPRGEDDACVSESSASGCSLRNSSACRADHPARASQVHLSLAGPGAMRVAWKTRGDMPKAMEVVVSANMSSERGTSTGVERSVQYLSGHGHHHVAKLTGLAPGATYQYRIVCDGVTTAYRTFEAPGGGEDASVLVIGDMGFGENGQAIASRNRIEALRAEFDAVVHVGDIGYADDAFLHGACRTGFCYESVYDHYMDWLENVSDSKPYMVAVGNHESECHSPACQTSPSTKKSLSNFSAYNARFAMPSQESGGVASMWYSFDHGLAHFVALNTETDFPGAASENWGDGGRVFGSPAGHFAPDGAYLRWLEADLARANQNRAERPWVVAFGHRPGLWKNGSSRNETMWAVHAPLLQRYGVDLYLAGHIHSYHRLLPAVGNDVVPTIVTGGAGCDEFSWDKKRMGIWDELGSNSLWDFRYFNNDTQVGMLKVSREELSFTAIASSSGDVIDFVSLRKDSLQSVHI